MDAIKEMQCTGKYDLRDEMKKRPAIQIPRGMECGMCGVEFWTHTVNHWHVCKNPRCNADAALKG
jgi:hypothetical protein